MPPDLVVKKGSKIRCIARGEIPLPESLTNNLAQPSASIAVSVTLRGPPRDIANRVKGIDNEIDDHQVAYEFIKAAAFVGRKQRSTACRRVDPTGPIGFSPLHSEAL
jgi:hypothetical protein